MSAMGANAPGAGSVPEPARPAITIRGVTKTFEAKDLGTVVALDGIDLDVAKGEFVCLLGPSGCGKSTLLNAVAGFSLPTSGSVKTDGVEVTAPGPDRAMVFQEYALFPWMTVFANVAFGLEIKGVRRGEIKETVDALLATLHLTEFRERFPKDLSDRIVVMTYRPGRVKKIVEVGMPRLRDVSSPEFNKLKRELTEMVMEEQRRHAEAEARLATAD